MRGIGRAGDRVARRSGWRRSRPSRTTPRRPPDRWRIRATPPAAPHRRPGEMARRSAKHCSWKAARRRETRRRQRGHARRHLRAVSGLRGRRWRRGSCAVRSSTGLHNCHSPRSSARDGQRPLDPCRASLVLLRHRRLGHAAAGADPARPRRDQSPDRTAAATRAARREKFAWLEAQGIRAVPAGRQRGHQCRADAGRLGGGRGQRARDRPRGRTGLPADEPRRTARGTVQRRADAGSRSAGTSGKSTVTGMLGWILHAAGRDADDHERRGDEELRRPRRSLRQRARSAAASFT